MRALNGLQEPIALVRDVGSFCTIAEHLWHASAERPYIGSNNGRFMGTAIPGAIGASLALEQPTACLVGDGGIRMYPTEIKLAVVYRLPICFILMRDGRFGGVACAPQPKPMSSVATNIVGPSWLESVEGTGCQSVSVETEAELCAALGGWSRQEPIFIEACFDPDAYCDTTQKLR
jgi:acetolactate synthase-1/2/3 large subunit